MAKKQQNEISKDRAEELLQNVFSACSVPPNSVPMELLEEDIRHHRFITVLTRVLAILALLILLALPLMTVKAGISSSVGMPEGKSLTVTVEVDSFLPIREISFTLDGSPLSYEKGDGGLYLVSVPDNGTFCARVVTYNNAVAEDELEIRAFVCEKPKIVSHEYRDGRFFFVVERGGCDVDFAGIYALDEAGEKKLPASFNKETGEVVFEQVTGAYNFFIPDVRGNVLQAILTPVES